MMGWNLKRPLVYVSSSVGITTVEEELDPLADFVPQWPLAVLHPNRGGSLSHKPGQLLLFVLCISKSWAFLSLKCCPKQPLPD